MLVDSNTNLFNGRFMVAAAVKSLTSSVSNGDNQPFDAVTLLTVTGRCSPHDDLQKESITTYETYPVADYG